MIKKLIEIIKLALAKKEVYNVYGFGYGHIKIHTCNSWTEALEWLGCYKDGGVVFVGKEFVASRSGH